VRHRGVPLLKALEMYSDRELWEEFEKFRDRGELLEVVYAESGGRAVLPGDYFDPFISAEEKLVSSFKEKLKDCKLVATGIERKKPFSPPSRIPPALWDTLTPHFRESSASGGGFRFAGILVSPAEEVGTVAMERRLRAWFVGKVASGYRPASFGTTLEDARSELGVDVPERMLRRIWVAQAPPDLKKPGRKPKRRIDTPI